MTAHLLVGNSLELLRQLPPASFDAVVTDPPYGETSLKWDRWPTGWPGLVLPLLKDSGSLWCFGSMRMFLRERDDFDDWRFVQELVWEKQGGTNRLNDRFRRVHEYAVQFVPRRAKWSRTYKNPVRVGEVQPRRECKRAVAKHLGGYGHRYVSGGVPRLMRSVVRANNCQGYARHPTQKPTAIVEPLLRYSVPPGGAVLDPFAGSGTTLVVAQQMGLRATGIEASESYAAVARERLRTERSPT